MLFLCFLLLVVSLCSKKVKYKCFTSKSDCDLDTGTIASQGELTVDDCYRDPSYTTLMRYNHLYCYNKKLVKLQKGCRDSACTKSCYSGRTFAGQCEVIVGDGLDYCRILSGCDQGATATGLHVTAIIFLSIGLLGCCCCCWTIFFPLGFFFFLIAMLVTYGVC